MRLTLPVLLSAAPSLAEEPTAQPTIDCAGVDATVCGRRHFEAGTAAFEQNDFSLAAAEFQAAIAVRPHPVIRFNLALSLARLGRPTAAIEQLGLVQQDRATDKDLKARAEREQRSAEQALSRVTFRLSDPSRERVELDGAPIAVQAGGELTLDPGSHHVRIISGNSVVLDQVLELSPGERVELRVGERSRRIDIVVVPDATAPRAVAPRPEPAPSPPRSRRPLSPLYFYAGAGVTAVLAGVTVWSGLDTRSALSDYERELPRLSQARADERVEDGHARELRTNLLLAGTLLAGAGTAVLGIWLVDFDGQAQASLGLTPSGVQASGRF